MTYSGHRRDIAAEEFLRVRFTKQDIWLAVLIALLSILALVAGAWWGENYPD